MPRTSTTRAAQGSGTIRQRKDGRWEARYTVGRDPGTGRQIQRSIYGESEKEVLRKLQSIQVDLTNGTYTEPSKMTVGAWLDIWLKEYTNNVKERTHSVYKGFVEHRIKPALGKVKLSALKPHQIQGFYNGCLRGDNGKRALSPKTIKDIHGIIHKALKQAVELSYLKINPAEACKLPRAEKPQISPLDEKQIAAFLKEISGHKYETLYRLTLFSGIRQGEALGLAWPCVDFEAGTITIEKQLQLIGGTYKAVSVKNDKVRIIKPAPAIMKRLQARKNQQAAEQLKAGSLWDNPLNLVFTNEFGRNLARHTVYKNFKAIVKRIGLDDTRFHDMRHSYAVAALSSGDDVKTVQANLGHHSAAFTLDQYGHVTDKMREDSANRMERFIESVQSL